MPRSTHLYAPAFAVALLLSSTLIFAQEESGAIGKREQQVDTPPATDAPANAADGKLYFTFERAPWRDVIKWLAGSADLALHVNDLPVGSFTYSDPKPFTVQEAMSRVNLFLLPEGFTLVRSGRLLSVINVGDPRSLKQLDSLAKLVTLEELNSLEEHDVVKCFFSLGDLNADAAVDELAGLNLMTRPTIFERTKRMLIIERVGKLKSVQKVLDGFAPSALNNGTVVRSFSLKHVDAEDVMEVARPHLGLATGEMIGIDVSVSADIQGKNIFVTGVDDKVKLLEGLIASIDKSDNDGATSATAVLKSHPVTGGNAKNVYEVLLTVLAGKSVRLSMDEKADSIVALAEPDVQNEIAQTVSQLQAADAEFEVIPLANVDPYFAVSLLEEMLDIDAEESNERRAWWEEPSNDDDDSDTPKIDADAGNRRLFVRAKKAQMDQIKQIVAGLDGTTTTETSDETFRVLPYKGKLAERILKTAGRFWRGKNPVVLFPSVIGEGEEPKERVVAESNIVQTSAILSPQKAPTNGGNVQFLSNNLRSQAPPIRCQLTQQGILTQCEDPQALSEFSSHVRAVAGPGDTAASEPIVFYLKYTKPDIALRMLAELIDGGQAAKEGEAGSLVNGYSDSVSSMFLASLVTSGNGAPTLISGSITVVGDARLNRLIAQGTTKDIEKLEGYLKIIDKDNSITDVLTYGSSQVIELRNTSATEVATLLREAYGSRLASGSTPTGGAAAAKAPPRKTTEADKKSKKEPSKSGSSTAPKNPEPKMTIAVHELSNSLVVTAPAALFQEVAALAKQIDSRSEQTVRIIEQPNTTEIESQLLRVFGDRVQMSKSTSSVPGRVSKAKKTKSTK